MRQAFCDDPARDIRLTALRPEALGESWRLRRWLRKMRLTAADAIEHGFEASGLVYLSLPMLAAARIPVPPFYADDSAALAS